MKKTILSIFVFGFLFFNSITAQVLNENANWPNTQWSLSGAYDSAFLYENPTVSSGSSFFSFDDDNAGSASVNNVAAESPVINLSNASNAGETQLTVVFPYVLNIFQNETLELEYWDADTNQWVSWGSALNANSGAQTNFCNASSAAYTSSELDISSFSNEQLQGFKYRIHYDDNGSYGWGFCVTSPSIISGEPPACPSVSNLSVSNVNASSAQSNWNAGGTESSWQVALALTTDPVPSSGTHTNTAAYNFTGLLPETDYILYVRANCTIEGYSNWVNQSFTTGIDTSGYPVTFTTNPIGTTGTYDIAMVDLNGDFLDDIVSVSTSNINIHYQLPSGGFNPEAIPTSNADFLPSWSLAAGDFDANGYNDLLYGGGSGVTFMKANSDGTGYTEISGSEYVFSQRSNFVDINNDGNLDAFVCHDIQANVYYINDGNGNLTFYQGESPGVVPNGLGTVPGGGNYATVWIDFDNDRDMDMFIAKCRGGSTTISTNELWRNDGNGVFINVADSNGWYSTNYPGAGHNNSSNLGDNVQTWASAWADFDNDGDMDVFVGASSTANGNSKLMRNNGDGSFTDVTAGSGVLAANLGIENAPADFDNDGYVDILSNGDVLFNNGDFTFTNFANNMPPSGAIGDANNDGFLDVFRNGSIYINNTNTNNWVKINTVGMGHTTPNRSNRNGIGARVEVTTNTGTQIRDVRSGEGFKFMSSLNTHFGLGADTAIQELKIYWPSGTIDVILDPAINTTHTIIEGSSLGLTDESLADVSIYPNPVKNELTIKTTELLTDNIASIFDVNGKRLLSTKLDSNQLDVSFLQTGFYVLRIESNGRFITRKFIKK